MMDINRTSGPLLLMRAAIILNRNLLDHSNHNSRGDGEYKRLILSESKVEVLFLNTFKLFFYLDKMYLPSLYFILLPGMAMGILTQAGLEAYLVVQRSPLMAALLRSSTMQSAFVARSPTASRLVPFLHPIISYRGSSVSAKQ